MLLKQRYFYIDLNWLHQIFANFDKRDGFPVGTGNLTDCPFLAGAGD